MKKIGIALIALGFYCVLFAFNMDVVVGTTYNIGLMNERQNVVYLSGIVFLAGIILFGFGFSAKEESKNLNVFAISCFLSPVLLFVGIKIIVSVQELIKQGNIRKQNVLDAERYVRENEAENAARAKMLKEKLDKFIDNKNGTITYQTTGLTWQRCSVGQIWTGTTCEGDAKEFTWDDATKLTSNFAGYNDWRVPTIDELKTLVHCSNGLPKTWNDTGDSCVGNYDTPVIANEAFPNTPRDKFWSSSSNSNQSSSAWRVDFDNGSSHSSYMDFKDYVRFVR
jgi:Protein of unknown function (DUF1566)